MSGLREIFSSEGDVRNVSGATPFEMNDPTRVWMALEGMLDIFVLEKRGDDMPGAREYFFTAAPGQGSFGMDGSEYSLMPGFERVMLAVGRPGTVAASLPLKRFQELARDAAYEHEAAQFIDVFIVGLSKGLTKDIIPSPKGQLILPASGEMALERNEYAGSRKAPVWVESTGRYLYIGMEEVAPGEDGPAFPLAPLAWIQAMDDVQLTCMPTLDALRAGKVWPGFAACRETFFNSLDYNARFVAVDAYNSMLARMRSDEQSKGAGLRELVGVLDQSVEKPLSHEARENALIAACEIVGRHLGMSITPPLKNGAAGKKELDVEDIAASSRIRTRKVALREKWWKYDAGPLVAFMEDGNKPVALLPMRNGRYELHDPEAQSKNVVTRKIAEQLSDFGHSFYPYLPERSITGFELFKFGMKHCARDIWVLLLFGLGVGFLGLVPPMVMATVFNDIVPYADRSRLLEMTGILLACSIGVAGLEFVRNTASLRIATRMHGGVEAAVMDRILRMPLPFFRRQTAGDLAERALGVTRVREVVNGALISAILNGFFAIASMILLFYYHSTLAWWAIGGFALYVFVMFIAWNVQLRYRRKLSRIEGVLSGKVLQFITGIPKLRAGGGEGRAFSIWAKMFGEQRAIAYKAGLADKALMTFTSLFPVLASMGVFLGVVYYLDVVEMDTGVFIAFNAAFGNVMMGLTQITMSMTMIINTWPYAERIAPIIEAPPEASEERTDPGELTGRIEVESLTFRYHDDSPLVLKGITLNIEPGEFVALAGPSGSGKSTLMRLLLGFENPTTGSIYYDDMDMRDLDPGKVRKNMGVVIQNSSVMPGDLFTNIVGTRQLTMDDAWEAAKQVGLYKDIKAMPMGMHTVVTEGGSTLSGGQKQRLLIARALVNRPRILFMDEATSALDNRNQAIVSESLERIKATRILVAHRLSTIRNADRIIVMDRGEIKESGTYDELMDMGGMFQTLVKRQIL